MSERKITKLYESLRELGQVSPDQVPQEAIETIASSFEVSGEIQSNAVALLAHADYFHLQPPSVSCRLKLLLLLLLLSLRLLLLSLLLLLLLRCASHRLPFACANQPPES